MSFNRSRYNRKSFRASPHRSSYGARSDYNPRYQRHHRAERRGHYEDRSYDYAPQRYSSPHHSRRYSKYHYPQPSGEVFIEEPETESEVDSESEYDGLAPSEDDERTYDFDLESNDDDSASEVYYDSDGFPEGEYEEIFVIPEDFDGVDMNDEFENDAIDALEAAGAVRDVNDDLLRFYDSDSDSEVSSSDEYDSDLESEIHVMESFDSNSDSESSSSSDSSDTESYTDLDIDSDQEIQDLKQALAQVIESADEDSSSDSEDDVFIEIDSDFYDSEDDAEDDIVVDEDISSESSDDEGITIYKHRFDLPDRYDSDNDSTDPELDFSDDELLLQANDSDDEFDVIDLSKELRDSKECEVVELDDSTYKLNLRLPSLIKEDLKINFLKNENELVINGKFNFTLDENDSEADSEDDFEDAEEKAETRNEEKANKPSSESSSSSSSSDSESSSDSDSESSSSSDSDSDSDSESESESDSESSSSSSSESESESDEEEEIQEDAQELIKDLQNHEIQFEKRFVFDKVVKFDEIKASFLENGELELIIPNEGVEIDAAENNVAISIEGQPQSQRAIDTEQAEVEAVAEAVAEAATADVEMAT
ncbi:hypothetical protein OXX80_002744 [Metschnikowia pulcherrima]